MAMYYYASKLSAIACGTRCKHTVGQQRHHGQRDRNKGRHKSKSNDDESEDEKDAKTLSPITSALLNGGDKIILGTSSELPEFSCDNAPDIQNSAMGTGGVLYNRGNIISGPQDSLVDLLLPNSIDDLDKEYIFSFLLSSRLFIRPHELLGRLLLNVPEEEPLDRLVALLSIWTNTFPYDFRDERIMCHVKHIVARCANTGLGDVVSELLSALLNRLTELEQHEKELRACQSLVDETELIKWPSATQLAQILCRIERKLAKHIGPEEFVQCSSTVHINRQNKKSENKPSVSGSSPGQQDSKKTCNLESYLDWSAKLRLLVSNEILLCNGIRDRSKVVELWSGVAQYCLLVGNYNSATVILESLESPAIARLQTTGISAQMGRLLEIAKYKTPPIISSPKGRCPTSNPKNRVNAGYAGIPKEVCLNSGNCWDDSIRNVNWCFRPNICDNSRVSERRDCGYPGISQKECSSRGCCFDSSIRGKIYCYQPFMCLSSDPKRRIEAGYAGITREDCVNKGGCFDDSIRNVKWCYKPTLA